MEGLFNNLSLGSQPLRSPIENKQQNATMPFQSHRSNYCLYKREDMESPVVKPEGTPNTLDIEELSVKLEILYTDLDAKDEKPVRKYLLHKATRNGIEESVQIGILPNFVSKSKISGTTICYFSQINLTPELFDSFNKKVESDVDYSPPKYEEFIICLICEVENDEGFTLFRPDLDIFCQKIQKLLRDVRVYNHSDEILKDYLKSWYTYSIEYINRCMDLLKDKLAVFLHGALLGKGIVIDEGTKSPSTFVEDITKFIAACSLNSLNIPSAYEKREDSLVVSLDSQYTLHVNSKETNAFCREWAKQLRSGNNPLQIRNLIDQQKLKVVQEFNQLHRLIEAAKLNNYAMYKAYRVLKHSNNSDVLLSLLLQDPSNDENAFEVLRVTQSQLSN